MDKTNRLLSLPFELREMIWEFSASTRDACGLLTCCHQTRDEFPPYYQLPQLPDDVSELIKIKILVDSTYDGGVWLRLHYTWKQNGRIWRAVGAVQDMNDPIIYRLVKMTKVHDIIVVLRAPRRGHFVGAFMMMFAKMNDVYYFIATMSERSRKLQRGYEDMGLVTIKFTTENMQLGQSAKEAKNFWECRATEVLQDPLRKYLKDPGRMPCFYEYFLIFPEYKLPVEPKIEYDTWPRSHVHREYHLPDPGSATYWTRRVFEEQLPYLQKHFATHAAKRLATQQSAWGDVTACQRNLNTAWPQPIIWEHINYDTISLMCRYQFLLDNLSGPVGGCLDMLRLHRFKTMDAPSRSNYFARFEHTAINGYRGLSGASSKINHHLRTMFDPCATEDIRSLRHACPHLRAVSWATNSNTAPESLSRSRWLNHYPDGIRYHWNGQNLVEWCFRWEAKKGRYRVPCAWMEDRLERLTRRWECMGCCQDSVHSMRELAPSLELRLLRTSNSSRETCDTTEQNTIHRPVIMRRECFRELRAANLRKPSSSEGGYRLLGLEYKRWAQGSPSKETQGDLVEMEGICWEYSVQALCGPCQ